MVVLERFVIMREDDTWAKFKNMSHLHDVFICSPTPMAARDEPMFIDIEPNDLVADVNTYLS